MKFLKFIFMCTLLICICSCAATNLIHESRKNSIINSSEMRMLTDVSIDFNTNSIYLCLLGNFKDREINDNSYTLIITGNMIDKSHKMIDTKNNTVPSYWISYEKFVDGCSFRGNEDLTLLNLKSIKINSGYHKTTHIDINKISPNIYSDIKSVSYIYESDDKESNILVTGANASPFSSSANRFVVNIQGNNNYSVFTSFFRVQSVYGKSYKQHDFELAGNIIDVLTAIIQVPVCLITIESVCSQSPHPNINLY